MIHRCICSIGYNSTILMLLILLTICGCQQALPLSVSQEEPPAPVDSSKTVPGQNAATSPAISEQDTDIPLKSDMDPKSPTLSQPDTLKNSPCPFNHIPTFFVDGQHNPENGDSVGHSWQNAFKSIQLAVDAASQTAAQCGKTVEVWVKQGRYYIANQHPEDMLLLRQAVRLRGGFDGTETAVDQRDILAHPTILDARADETSTLRARHIIVAETDTHVDGITLTGGHAAGKNLEQHGAALFAKDANIVITNCTFTANTSDEGGGAIYVDGGSTQVISSTFSANFSLGEGGAIQIDKGDIRIEKCRFIENDADNYGGAIFADNAKLKIKKSEFISNNALSGGAVALGESDFDMENSLLVDNTAYFAGGIYDFNTLAFSVRNCTFAENYAEQSGASILFDTGDNQGEINILNSIFSGGYPEEISLPDTTDNAAIQWNIIENNEQFEGNIHESPAFAPGGYQLSQTSPAIDAALDEAAPNDDINDKPRQSADMGAFEF